MLASFYVFENVFFIFLKTCYHANISSSKSYSYVITLLVRLLFPARTPLAHTPYCSYAYCSYRFVHIMSIETKLWLNIVLIKYKFYTYEDHYKITTLNSQIFSFHLLLELGTNIKSTTTSPITQITIIKVIWATHPQSLFWAANNWCDGLTSSNHEPKLYPLSIAPQQKKTLYVSKYTASFCVNEFSIGDDCSSTLQEGKIWGVLEPQDLLAKYGACAIPTNRLIFSYLLFLCPMIK